VDGGVLKTEMDLFSVPAETVIGDIPFRSNCIYVTGRIRCYGVQILNGSGHQRELVYVLTFENQKII
jgi:hypothetical protein